MCHSLTLHSNVFRSHLHCPISVCGWHNSTGKLLHRCGAATEKLLLPRRVRVPGMRDNTTVLLTSADHSRHQPVFETSWHSLAMYRLGKSSSPWDWIIQAWANVLECIVQKEWNFQGVKCPGGHKPCRLWLHATYFSPYSYGSQFRLTIFQVLYRYVSGIWVH